MKTYCLLILFLTSNQNHTQNYYLNFEQTKTYIELLKSVFNKTDSDIFNPDSDISICSENWVFEESPQPSKLSTGEFFFLELFTRINAHANELKEGHLLFLFDEVDLGFHPAWQRQIINILIQSLPKMLGNNVQIIVTSHSPFIVSDLPNENVIFLTKDSKTGNSIVKDSLKDMKQTFGANIHTLLSNSFFMESLMGDFAKSKIDAVLKTLNDPNSTTNQLGEAEKVINMVGEPVIKRYLQKELANKRLKKIDEIDDLKKRIEQLESKLKNTEGGKNDTN